MKPNDKAKHRNFNDLKTRTMTDNEIKEDCLQEAGIDLGRYSHTELTEIKDALRRYHNAKLKLLGLGSVRLCLQTEDESYNEMERRFNLHFEEDEKMQIDDTQIGWEECYKFISKNNEA